MATNQIAAVNIYRAGSEWCYAALVLDPHTTALQHDHSDTLGVASDASEADAAAAATAHFPGARVTRVDDIR